MVELREHLQIAAVEVADIFDAVAHHGKAGEAETKREAGVFIGVDAAGAQHVRVNHTARAKLNPAGTVAGGAALAAADVAADVKLKARLNEREEARAQANLYVLLKDLRKHGLHEVDEVRNGDVFINHDAFHLEKRVLVGSVCAFVAEAATREDGTQRCTVLFHDGVLRGRGVGLQQLTVIEIVGVLHVAGGVMLRNVQCLKAVVIRYDLAVVFNRKAHGSENFFQLALHERDGVIGAAVGIHRVL